MKIDVDKTKSIVYILILISFILIVVDVIVGGFLLKKSEEDLRTEMIARQDSLYKALEYKTKEFDAHIEAIYDFLDIDKPELYKTHSSKYIADPLKTRTELRKEQIKELENQIKLLKGVYVPPDTIEIMAYQELIELSKLDSAKFAESIKCSILMKPIKNKNEVKK